MKLSEHLRDLLERQTGEVMFGDGTETAAPGRFKASAKMIKMLEKDAPAEWKDEMGRVDISRVLWDEQQKLLKAISREDLPALVGAENIPDAQDVLANQPREAFKLFLRNVAKVSPRTAKLMRAVPVNVSLYWYIVMARISGRDMADDLFKKYFSTDQGGKAFAQAQKRLGAAQTEAVAYVPGTCPVTDAAHRCPERERTRGACCQGCEGPAMDAVEASEAVGHWAGALIEAARKAKDKKKSRAQQASEKYLNPKTGKFKGRKGEKFANCVKYMKAKGGVSDPKALCGTIARKKASAIEAQSWLGPLLVEKLTDKQAEIANKLAPHIGEELLGDAALNKMRKSLVTFFGGKDPAWGMARMARTGLYRDIVGLIAAQAVGKQKPVTAAQAEQIVAKVLDKGASTGLVAKKKTQSVILDADEPEKWAEMGRRIAVIVNRALAKMQEAGTATAIESVVEADQGLSQRKLMFIIEPIFRRAGMIPWAQGASKQWHLFVNKDFGTKLEDRAFVTFWKNPDGDWQLISGVPTAAFPETRRLLLMSASDLSSMQSAKKQDDLEEAADGKRALNQNYLLAVAKQVADSKWVKVTRKAGRVVDIAPVDLKESRSAVVVRETPNLGMFYLDDVEKMLDDVQVASDALQKAVQALGHDEDALGQLAQKMREGGTSRQAALGAKIAKTYGPAWQLVRKGQETVSALGTALSQLETAIKEGK